MRIDDREFLIETAGLCTVLADAPSFEDALGWLAAASARLLGDPAEASRPGALKPGERDYRVAGTFLITPDRRYNMLVGAHGFPSEQRRLMIPIGWNHPGIVVAEAKPLLVADTDADEKFRQFLKTSRMGSSIYAPVSVGGRMVGQTIAAAQARGTYDAGDLDRLCLFAGLVAALWRRFGGEAWLAADYPAADAWRAEEHAV